MGWYVKVTYFRPYFMGIFPEILALKIGQTYMVGTSNPSVPSMVIDMGFFVEMNGI